MPRVVVVERAGVEAGTGAGADGRAAAGAAAGAAVLTEGFADVVVDARVGVLAGVVVDGVVDGAADGVAAGVLAGALTGGRDAAPATALEPTPLGTFASGGTNTPGRAGDAAGALVVTLAFGGGAILVLGGAPRPADVSVRGDAVVDAAVVVVDGGVVVEAVGGAVGDAPRKGGIDAEAGADVRATDGAGGGVVTLSFGADAIP